MASGWCLMGRKDPDGTETRSEKEWRDRQDQVARDLVGEKKPNDKNPEGVPEGDKGHK